MVGGCGESKFSVGIFHQVRLAVLAPDRNMRMAAVAGRQRQRLGHEGGAESFAFANSAGLTPIFCLGEGFGSQPDVHRGCKVDELEQGFIPESAEDPTPKPCRSS